MKKSRIIYKIIWLFFALLISSSSISWAQETLAQRLVTGKASTWPAAFAELKQLDEKSKRACVAELIEYVRQTSDQIIREHAIGALSRMGLENIVVPETIPLLTDANPVVRSAGGRILAGVAGREKRNSAMYGSIVSLLKKSLQDKDNTVRLQSLGALGQMGAKDALPDLKEALKDNDRNFRRYVVSSINMIDLGVKEVVPVLAEDLKDADKTVRMRAARTLATLSWKVSMVIQTIFPELLQALKDPDAEVRIGIAQTLGNFCGPENKNIVPQLAEALKKTDNRFERVALVQALENIGSPEALVAAELYKQERDLLMRDFEKSFRNNGK